MRQPMPEYGGDVTTVHDITEWNALLARARQQGALVLVDCFARWCGPCRRAAPIFARLSESYTGVIFAKVDVDTSHALAAHLEITAMPTFVLFKDSVVHYKLQGFRESALRDMILKSGAQPVMQSGAEDSDSESSSLVNSKV